MGSGHGDLLAVDTHTRCLRFGYGKLKEETTMRRHKASLRNLHWGCVLLALVVISAVPGSTSGAERMVIAEEFTNVG